MRRGVDDHRPTAVRAHVLRQQRLAPHELAADFGVTVGVASRREHRIAAGKFARIEVRHPDPPLLRASPPAPYQRPSGLRPTDRDSSIPPGSRWPPDRADLATRARPG